MTMTKSRVLLIDDDKWLAELFAATLRQEGFSVAMAHEGLEGMEAINKQPPDVLVLDLMMPGPNGLVLLHELQSHADLADIPVVLCTNSASDIQKKHIASYGVRRVLDKTTMEPQDIVAAVKGCV